MPLFIIISMVLLSLYLPVRPCTFWFIMWHAWGQISLDLACNIECDSLWWPADGVLHPWSSPSVSGKSSLNCDGVIYGASWGCQFPFEGGGRRGRRQSTKGATGTGCAGIRTWQIVGCRICPRRRRFHANEVLLGMKTINRIVPRCFCNNTYFTIPRPT